MDSQKISKIKYVHVELDNVALIPFYDLFWLFYTTNKFLNEKKFIIKWICLDDFAEELFLACMDKM